MLSDKKVVCPLNLLEKASKKKGISAAIVNAGKPLPMLSVLDAVNVKLFMNLLKIKLLKLLQS